MPQDRSPGRRGSTSPDRDSRPIIARCRRMRKILTLVRRLARSDVSVVIEGESGTGKELIARAIHEQGPRRKHPFISENCAAFPDSLMESEFFGVCRGAFTGAEASREGILERTRGGTLFLDEVGELSLSVQAKLLKALQDMKVRRVGGSRSQRLRFRLVSATNRSLEEAVRERRFRLDLRYRLEVVKICLPPLRERLEDIPLLVDHFLKKHRPENTRQKPTVTPETLERFRTYWWPGNVRELENEICRALAFGHLEIRPEHLSSRVARPEHHGPIDAGVETFSFQDAEREILGALLGAALVTTGGNCSRAARLVGLTRPSFYRRLHRYGLCPREVLQHGPPSIRQVLHRYGRLDPGSGGDPESLEPSGSPGLS